MDFGQLRPIPGFCVRPLPRIFRTVVRHPQGAARRKLHHARAPGLQHLAQLLHSGPRRRLRRVPHVRPGLKLIRSRDNPQVKALVKLAGSSRERRETGTTLLEGEHLVRAYRESGGKAETIFAAETAMAKPEIRALLESAPAETRLVLADRLVDQISQLVSTAGVGAVVRTPESGPLPRTLASCLLLENIQDPGNLGSILRTAVAAGIPHVFLSRGSVFAWTGKVIRSGMGAHFFLSIFEDVDLSEF